MSEVSGFPTLVTKRLCLREIVDEDAEDLFAIQGDPDLMRWFGADPLKDPTAAQDLVKTFASWRLQPNPGTRWAIQTKESRKLIGTCGLFSWNRTWRKCVVGYELASHTQGQGFMREALSIIFTWGFEHMQLNRIEAQIHPSNLASIKLARSLGFVEEGRLRQVGYWGGQYHDMLQFSLLRSEWNQIS
jgi:[ribosomal protein S5]-alanine N-acetyltransferase